MNGDDQPGARTIGAIALQRWAARKTGDPAEGVDTGASPATRGPYDEGDLDPEQTEADKVDFGAVRIPVPRGGQVSVEPEEGRLQAVHVMLPTGRLSVSALAAPRTDRLWPDLATEIDESLREGGATVRSFTGEWGRELHARTGEASSVFVGVDGPRWMLYGVATGPTSAAAELDAALRRMLRGTVVVRGRLPYPVRTVLPLTVPEHLAEPLGAGPPRAERVPPGRAVDAPRRPTAALPGTVAPAGTTPAGAPPVGAPNGASSGRLGLGGPPPAARRPAAAAAPPVAPAVGEPPTEPHGLARVVTGPDANGRARVNGGRPSNGDRLSDRDPGRTGQRRVADLLADAERERRSTPAPSSAVSSAPSSPPPSPALPVSRATRPGPESARPMPPSRPEPDIVPVRLGDAPRVHDGGPGPVDPPRYDPPPYDPPWSVAASEPVRDPGADRPAHPVSRSTADGSDDWTLPMSIVPPAPAAAPEPGDLWAGDPWAAETRRAARAAQAAEAAATPTPAPQRPAHQRSAHERPGGRHGADQNGVERNGADRHGGGRHGGEHNGVEPNGGRRYAAEPHRGTRYRGEAAVDVPAARVRPPVLPALAFLADERTDPFDEPASGRHRRPER